MPLWKAPSELWALRMFEMLGKDLKIICTEKAPNGTEWNGVPVKGISNPPISISGKLKYRISRRLSKKDRYRSKQKKFEKLLKEYKIEVVLIHFLNYSLDFEPVLAKLKIPVFIHCHGRDVQWNMYEIKFPLQPVHDKEYPSEVVELPGHIRFIANSHLTKRNLMKIGLDENRIFVKYLGVPTPELPSGLSSNKGNKTTLSILFLGRLVDCKGPDIVILAFELAKRKGLDAELIIAGDGPLRITCELMRLRSEFREDIKLLGEVDPEKGLELRLNADIFTAHNCTGPITNQEEAFGVSILEAMAAEVPVISGRNGALTETVISGETGILVQPGDIEAHAQAFLDLAENPTLRKSMGKAGRKRVQEMFSYENEKRNLHKILQQPLNGQNSKSFEVF